ncbi:glycosyltransferase [Candidatus Omnitrophota bacterium]
MKIVIVYASAGNGHRRAAEAIHDCLKKDYPKAEASLIDIVEYTNSWFARFYSRGYSFLVVRLKALWAITYYLTNLRVFAAWFKFFSRQNCRPFINILKTQQPDIVVSTHFFPSEVVAHLKRKREINSRLVTIMTDFSPHALWLMKNCDDYIVALDYSRDCLIRRGIEQDTIKVLGIPIDSGFSGGRQRKAEPQELSALLITGAFGFSLIERAVDMLFSQIRLVVVCGNNQGLYNNLKRKNYPSIELFGFTKEIPRLMSQVDLIITKPGGLTTSEALAMELPMLLIGAIPGQESENARILEGLGCAIRVGNAPVLAKTIADLKAHREKLDLMRANIQKIRKPDSAAQICSYMMKDVR